MGHRFAVMLQCAAERALQASANVYAAQELR